MMVIITEDKAMPAQNQAKTFISSLDLEWGAATATTFGL